MDGLSYFGTVRLALPCVAPLLPWPDLEGWFQVCPGLMESDQQIPRIRAEGRFGAQQWWTWMSAAEKSLQRRRD